MDLSSVLLLLPLLIAAPQDAATQESTHAALIDAAEIDAASQKAEAARIGEPSTESDFAEEGDTLPQDETSTQDAPRVEVSESSDAPSSETDTESSTLEPQAATDEQPAAEAQGNIRYDGSGLRITSADGRYYARLGGYGQFLYQQPLNPGDTGNESGFKIKRVRTSLRFVAGDFTRFDLELNLRSSGVVVHTAVATVTPLESLSFRVGLQKSLLNPEQLHSSRSMFFLERAYLSDLTPQRDLGLSVELKPFSAMILELGVYNGADGGEVNRGIKNNKPELQARLQFSPTRIANSESSDANFWFGVGATHGVARDGNKDAYLGDASRTVSRRLDLSTNGGLKTNILRTDAFHDGPRTRVTGFFYGSVGNVRLTSEFLYTQMDLYTTGHATLGTRSWNVTGSYSFGGNANISRVDPIKNVGEGGLGALEVKARYHEALLWNMDAGSAPLLQVDPSTKEQARLRGASVGLSWWANPHIRLQADYHFTILPDNVRAGDPLPSHEHVLHFGATIGL